MEKFLCRTGPFVIDVGVPEPFNIALDALYASEEHGVA